jgi:hypothetical protein
MVFDHFPTSCVVVDVDEEASSDDVCVCGDEATVGNRNRLWRRSESLLTQSKEAREGTGANLSRRGEVSHRYGYPKERRREQGRKGVFWENNNVRSLSSRAHWLEAQRRPLRPLNTP